MKLKVTIKQQRNNNNAIDFRVKDTKGEIGEIRNCQMKHSSLMPFTSFYGAMAIAKGGFNEGHPVHWNQMQKDVWQLWMEESLLLTFSVVDDTDFYLCQKLHQAINA